MCGIQRHKCGHSLPTVKSSHHSTIIFTHTEVKAALKSRECLGCLEGSHAHSKSQQNPHTHTFNIPQCVVVVFWEKYSRMGFASKRCSSILSEELKLTETPQGEYDTSCFCSNTFSGCAWACALTYVEASLFPGLGMWHPHCNLLSGEDVEMDYWSPRVLRVSLPWRDQHSEVNEPICINFVPIWSIWVVWGNALPAFLHLHHQQPLT